MISEHFPETGWQIAHDGAPVTRYQVFGERSSGTNFVKRLLGRNTALAPTEALGWKHALPHMTVIPADTAVVCVVRHAEDWARSMHARPWHCPPDMQALDFAAFLRARWGTVADRARYFPQVRTLGGQGRPLQLDRHPLTGLAYANLFQLRRTKLEGLLSFFNRGCTVVLCRLEAVQGAPRDFVAAIESRFALPSAPEGYRPVTRRLGSRFVASLDPRPATPPGLSDEDRTFLRSQLDLGREDALGYRY
ncbi:hypothetical protein [Salipiger aestuarii]|uniref:hypothetical protein n=1 Tax=Salipiger aestuarii TaxID=568098 RepID=UPI00025B4653|nr:hypothetical protein [Salipiger aestuarii]EIE52320.1 hypothetical protein C357_04832 [Citreicella sp. 357]KAA8614233.1 hypothetical protein AL037_03350 [Salipiger aestuarii]